MKNFQTILLIIFGVLVVGAVLVFSGIIKVGGGSQATLATKPVTLWGTIPENSFETVMRQASEAGEKFAINYVEKKEATFESDLIDALASGKGPDMILAPHTLLIKQKDKLLLLPASTLPERTFQDSFVESGEVLFSAQGILGVPLYIDPLVMYWNRDMLTSAGLAVPPKTWLEVQLYPKSLTKVDTQGSITSEAVAMGGVANVNHFKEILTTQILQTGNPITLRTSAQGGEGKLADTITVNLSSAGGASSALRYYTEFANPSLPKYSWNSAKMNSLDEFIAGKLALYFGLASDLNVIKTKNPHLNFDVAEIPQNSSKRLTYGDVYAFAILKNSSNADAAWAVVSQIAWGKTASLISTALALPSARRDLLASPNTDPVQSVFQNSALISHAWLDPDSAVTRNIFAGMIESVIIGKDSPEIAVLNAEELIWNLF